MKDGYYGYRIAEDSWEAVEVAGGLVFSIEPDRGRPVADWSHGEFVGPIDFEALPKVDTAGGE